MKPSDAFKLGLGTVLFILGMLCFLYLIKNKFILSATLFNITVSVIAILWAFMAIPVFFGVIMTISDAFIEWLEEADKKYEEKLKNWKDKE